jgi:beta-glucuronidase
MRMTTALMATLACLAAAVASAQPPPAATDGRTRVSLTGSWRFAVDPSRDGEKDRWFAPDYADGGWDKVDVPHCWPLDPRFAYTGAAWYRRTFDVPPAVTGAGAGAAGVGAAGQHARIEFDAVFARARVWLNGQLLGSHEGGYTPFGFDVTPHLISGKPNLLVVEADNSWSTKTLPGARTGGAAGQRLYPWWDYGGIVRPVSLVLSAPVYVANQRIIATPDLASGSAAIDATVWIRNSGADPATMTVSLALARLDGDREQSVSATVSGASAAAGAGALQATASVPPGETTSVSIKATLPREAVQLWNLDRPVLYTARTSLAGGAAPDALASTFGIRRFEVRGTQLLLNGRAIRLGGANRPNDHPRFGLIEPREVVEQDLRLMKAGGMELQRMIHYALPTTLLDAADRLGVLLITEAGNWQLQPTQMDDDEIRANYKNQMREMVERDWNHPSVVAYSVGNEYPSDTPAGVRWTRDMAEYVKTLDASRPVTFASYRADRPEVARPEDEGSHYVDFICINMYGPPQQLGARLDRLHARWPDKPVFITEFGLRADKVADERERVDYFRGAIEVFRSRPFVVGASVWTFNDYRSRYPDTASNGYRPWGLVDPDRKPRQAYDTVKHEFAAARIVAAPLARASDGSIAARVTIEARADFPSRQIIGLNARVREAAGGAARVASTGSASSAVALPALEPGMQTDVMLNVPVALASGPFRIELVRADGSVMDHFDIIDAIMSAPTSDAGPAAAGANTAAARVAAARELVR